MARHKVTVRFPFVGVLGLIFITLKLTGHITWSWLWVLSPFWITFLLLFIIIFIAALIAVCGD